MGGRKRGPRLTAARRKGGPKGSPRRGDVEAANGAAGVLLDSRGLPSVAAPMPMHLLAVSRCLPAESADLGASPIAPRDCGLRVQSDAANLSAEAPYLGHKLRGQTSVATMVGVSELRPQLLESADAPTAKSQVPVSPTQLVAVQAIRANGAGASVVELEPELAASSLSLAAREAGVAGEDEQSPAQAHAVDSPGSPVEPVAHPRPLGNPYVVALAGRNPPGEELLVEESESMSDSESESESESESDSDSESNSESNSVSDTGEAGEAARQDVRIGRPRRMVQSSESDEESGSDSGPESDSASDSDDDDVASGGSSSEEDVDEVDEDVRVQTWSQGNRKRWLVRSQQTLSMRGRHTPPPPMEIVAAKRQKVARAPLERGASAATQKAEEEITPPAGNVSMQARVKPRPSDSSMSRTNPRPDRPARQRGQIHARGRGTNRGSSNNSGERQFSAKLAEPALSVAPNSAGRRASGRNRAAPVAFWTLDGLSRWECFHTLHNCTHLAGTEDLSLASRINFPPSINPTFSLLLYRGAARTKAAVAAIRSTG